MGLSDVFLCEVDVLSEDVAMSVSLSPSNYSPGGSLNSVVTCHGVPQNDSVPSTGKIEADLEEVDEEDGDDDADVDEESNGSSDEELEDEGDDDFDEEFDEDFEDLEYDLEEMGDDDVEKLNGKSCGIELDD